MSQSALQNVRKYGFPRLDVRGVRLLPAHAQRLRIPRLCQCRGPPDVVAVSVQGTPQTSWLGESPSGHVPAAILLDQLGLPPVLRALTPSLGSRPVPSLRSVRHSSGDLTCRSSAVLEDAPGWQAAGGAANVHESLGPP